MPRRSIARMAFAVGGATLAVLSVLYSVGTAGAVTFLPKTDYAAGTTAFAVATGDFNGDGNADLAVVNFGASTVSILLGTGTGTFGAKTDFATGTNPSSIAIGDLNGDGKLDIVTGNQTTNNVSVLLGTGTAISTRTRRPIWPLPIPAPRACRFCSSRWRAVRRRRQRQRRPRPRPRQRRR